MADTVRETASPATPSIALMSVCVVVPRLITRKHPLSYHTRSLSDFALQQRELAQHVFLGFCVTPQSAARVTSRGEDECGRVVV